MNTTIRDRLELLLAKIAGQNVNISSMTPGAASNLKEKLLLDIAKRIDNIAEAADAPSAATADKAGAVKMASNVAEAAGDAPTAAEFKALLDALIAAGIMAAPASSGEGN